MIAKKNGMLHRMLELMKQKKNNLHTKILTKSINKIKKWTAERY